MAKLLTHFRRLLGLPPATAVSRTRPSYGKSIDSDFSVFRGKRLQFFSMLRPMSMVANSFAFISTEGDRFIVNGKNPLLGKALVRNGRTETRRGTLEHDSIIGRSARDLVQAHKGQLVMWFLGFWVEPQCSGYSAAGYANTPFWELCRTRIQDNNPQFRGICHPYPQASHTGKPNTPGKFPLLWLSLVDLMVSRSTQPMPISLFHCWIYMCHLRRPIGTQRAHWKSLKPGPAMDL